MLNGITSCGMTKLDVLSGLDEIKVCVAYEYDGKRSERFQTNLKTLERMHPVYETFPGWKEDISGVTSFHDLPQTARDYIDAVERIIGVRIACASVGPERSQILFPGNEAQW
jgi:adenylosuccinate synthase